MPRNCPAGVWAILHSMEITAATYIPKLTLSEGAELYKELCKRICDALLFERSYFFYGLHALCVFSAITFTYYFLRITSSALVFAALAVALALCLSQLGGYMHDAAHMMVFKTRCMNDLFGGFCASLIFMNYNSWKLKHAAHHAHPNHEGHDPDLEIPIFSFTETRYKSKTGLERRLRRYQAYLYFPLSFLLAYSLQFKNSIKYLVGKAKRHGFNRAIAGELIIFGAGFFLWYMLPFLVFDFPKAVLLVIIVPVTSGFYIASVFAPNHKGMPVIDRNTRLSFLEQQIITSRNIADNWFTDFIYLSLNYQIEHHLFAECPRNKLKRVTPYIEELCRARGLPFTVVGLRESFGVILEGLSSVVRQAEQARAAQLKQNISHAT
jgi:fatty acid desaturase